ncbi:tripartite tricarboxylate transporter TctB family protein [Cumulibacter manganitolerans]|uniref:tripartite tricarboxylate transporter TctB family protein n=1 Tax=Cumulibacter manganitolerans TaxID=1884992 RepID=UPI00129548B7|nr:tripartite tricarboxylate transporter TctB family protein [Cumulibacter manganitolerans]
MSTVAPDVHGSTRRAEASLTLALTVLGVGMIVGALDYGVGSLAAPGSGFVPLLIGIGLVFFAASLLLSGLRARRSAHVDTGAVGSEVVVPDLAGAHDQLLTEAAEDSATLTARLSPSLAIAACIGCFAFVLLATSVVGLLVTAAVVVGVLAYIMRTSWWASLLVGIGFYVAGYLVFAMWLSIPLPFGSMTAG